MGRFKNSWNFFKCSLPVIIKNKKLLSFPMIQLFFIVIIGMFFVSPIILWDSGHSIIELSHWEALGEHYGKMGEQYGKMLENQEVKPETIIDMIFTKTMLAWCALFYLISMFSVTFINVAFYNEIINGLNGKRVSLLRGIKAAFSKIKLIMIWSLFAGLVGMIIRTLEERLGFVGRWIMGLIGIAWSVASIFVIPVIIREEKTSNPLKLLKTSALMLKKTWGETVIGFVGMGGLFLVCFLISLPLFIIALAFVLSVTLETWAIALMFLLYIIFMIALAYLVGVTRHVYRGALYVYASEGVVPGLFDEEMMNRAWKVKKARKT